MAQAPSCTDQQRNLVGEAGFEPATARPPAGGRDCHIRPAASHLSCTVDDSDTSDITVGAKAVPRPSVSGFRGRRNPDKRHVRRFLKVTGSLPSLGDPPTLRR